MTPVADSQLMEAIRLDRALQYTVIQSWDELMPDPGSGLIHIEYQAGRDDLLEFLLIWAAPIRGTWKLVCEFWMQPLWSHATGLRFGNSYRSEIFARDLNLVINQEKVFSKLPNQVGLIQVYPPTQEERKEADQWMKLLLDRRILTPKKQPAAA